MKKNLINVELKKLLNSIMRATAPFMTLVIIFQFKGIGFYLFAGLYAITVISYLLAYLKSQKCKKSES